MSFIRKVDLVRNAAETLRRSNFTCMQRMAFLSFVIFLLSACNTHDRKRDIKSPLISDTLDMMSLSKVTYPVVKKLIESGITDFFIFENSCHGYPDIDEKYDSCIGLSKRYVFYNLTSDSMSVRKFGNCGLFKEKEKRVSIGSMKLFHQNRSVIKKEEFQSKAISFHGCYVRLFEINNRKLVMSKGYADFMVDLNKKYEKSNKELITYKLLTGLRMELSKL
jgi:hypothetical protein